MQTTEGAKQTINQTVTGGPSLDEMNAIVALFQQADWPRLEASSRAMAAKWPQNGFGWKSLGVALKMLKRDDEALQIMRKAAEIMPNDPDVHNNLGSALREAGEYTEAITHFEQALALNPDFPDALNGLAITLKKHGDAARVMSLLRRAVELRPDFPEAQYNLGNAIKAEGKVDEAIERYMEALRLRPGYADAYNSLGNALMLKGEPEEAMACYQKALTSNPTFHEALNGMGNALRAVGKLDEAIVQYRKAIDLKPDHEGFHHNLAIAYSEKLLVDQALECYRKALRLAPDSASSKAGLGMLLIALGEMDKGWELYESRWEGFQQAMEGTLKRPETSLPQWKGEAVANTDALLLFCEQGLGDSLQFIRYVPLLAARFAKLTVVCPTALLNIFRGSFQIANVEFVDAHPENQAAWQWHCTTMSVPLAMHTTLDNLPANIPYLVAPENRIRHWSDKLKKLDSGNKPRIGLVWAGGNLLRDDKKRSIPPEQFLPLTAHHEMTWVSLQKAHDDKKKAKDHHRAGGLIDWMDEIRDFADTAALIENLDLILTVDTAVAHLAGALGKPVWMLNRYAGDFRWMFQREDSPWYPGMRIFRQPEPGDWASVLAKVQLALEAWHPTRKIAPKAAKEPSLQEDLQALFDRFTRDDPDYVESRDALFSRYRNTKNIDLSKQYVELLNQFGYSFFANRNLQQACKFWRETLALHPDDHYALHHLGIALTELNQHEEACAQFRRAVAVEPERYYSHYTLAASLLTLGQWEEGWRYYEYRWKGSDKVPDQANQQGRKKLVSLPESLSASLKPWRGEQPAKDDALLLYIEQGFGDQIQFIRLLPQVASRFGRIDLYCGQPLFSLFAHCLASLKNVSLIDDIPKDTSAWQWHCPLLSLPLALGLRPDNIPQAPYLEAPPARLATWHQRLGGYLDGKPLVGIAWTGSSTLGADRQRSIDPLMLISLLTDQRIRWVNLQKGDSKSRETPAPIAPLLIDLMHETRDFADTAALIAHLDLVITVDTSVAHLAGAMGKPVWLLNRYSGDWRWMGQQATTPWYASMRIFNQHRLDQWQEVLNEVSEEIESWLKQNDPAIVAPEPDIETMDAHAVGDQAAPDEQDEARRLLALFNAGELDRLAKASDAIASNERYAGFGRWMRELACRLQTGPNQASEPLAELTASVSESLPGDVRAAARVIHEAVTLYEQSMAAQHDRALALHKMAALLLARFNPEASVTYYRKVMQLKPQMIEALTNLGTGYMRLGAFKAALDHYQQALHIRPEYVDALNGLAVTYKHMGECERAAATLESALAIQPGNAELLNNLAATLLDMHRTDEAIILFRRSIAADANYHAAHMGLALALLLKGEWAEGWRHYERRWQGSNFALQGMVHKSDTSLPHWEGQAVETGARLVVFCEQGLGDNLQFVRYIPLLAERFAKVTLFCHAPLYHILAGSFSIYPNVEVTKILPNDHSAWDYHCYIMSLPLAFGTTLKNVPNTTPYLRSPSNRVSYWAERLAQAAGDKPRVGLVWAGGKALRDDRQRSIPLERFSALLEMQDIAWVSLQKDYTADSPEKQACHASLIDWMPEIVDFADTAALIDNLDLVISVDTSVAHLAGALGRPIWLLNRYAGDWRWMLDREDSPWYPSMRIFNQDKRDDWSKVFADLAPAIRTWAKSLVPERPMPVPSDPMLEHAQGMIALFNAHRWAELEQMASEVTEANPEFGFGFKALGIALKKQSKDKPALRALRRAAELLPDDPEVHNNLANVLQESGDTAAALEHYASALAHDPRLDDAHSNMAVLLYRQGQVEQAIGHFEQALSIKPESASTLFNLGVAYKDMKQPEKALQCYESAMASDPAHHDARWNAALALLSMGHYERGWALYEARFLRAGRKPLQETPYPLWLGEAPLAGKKLLIQHEQGFGDAIQMARYLPMLQAMGGRCWFQCHESLMSLIKRSFPQTTVIPTNVCPLDLDYRIPLMSLPLALKTYSESAIPNQVPYLIADAKRIEYWQTQLAGDMKTVGLAWRGNPTHVHDAKRSMPLEALLPLVKAHPKVQFYSLQKALSAAERKLLGHYPNVRILDAELKDFDETAAIVCNLDLVITIDSVLLHLAGALGRPAWGLLAYCREWRWLIDRKDSPWYPGVRLFSQRVAGDWTSLVKDISGKLK